MITNNYARPYIIGVDVSWIQEEEYAGVKYFHNGVEKEIFTLLKDHGINFIRYRTFVDPCGSEGYSRMTYNRAPGKECWCDLPHTISFGKRVKAAGMGFLLDFHMSDTWASIGVQKVPSSWAGLNDTDMRNAAYNHVKNTIESLIEENARPDMVQVGNEINSHMSGISINSPDRLAGLINAGVKAVRDVDPTIKIVMQHGRPRPDGGFANWYNFIKSRVDFDFIGGSTYGTTNNGQDWRDMFGLAVTDGYQVMSLEYTAQRTNLINTVMSEFPNEMGLGSFVWEPTNFPHDKIQHRMFTQEGKNYHANANLEELASWAQRLNAELPDFVKFSSGKQYQVSTQAGPGGNIKHNPATEKIDADAAVEFTAIPLEGWRFNGWSGDITGNVNPYIVENLSQDLAVKATFEFVGTDSNHYEGENTEFSQARVENKHFGFSGTGYIDFDNVKGSFVEFAVVAGADADYLLTITYANGAMDERPVAIAVNGEVVDEAFGFTPTETWASWENHDLMVPLRKGINTITMTAVSDNGGPNIDKITLSSEKNTPVLKAKRSVNALFSFAELNQFLSWEQSGELQLFSLTGQLLWTQKVPGANESLPVNCWEKGLYFLRLKTADKVKVYKLIN